MKKLILLIPVLLIVAGCASKQPPPVQVQQINIPVQLVNIEVSNVGELPEEPSTAKLVKINSGDPADDALDEVLDYTKDLHDYAKGVTQMLGISEKENAVMRSKLNSIKQYILLSQDPTGQQQIYRTQPVPY